MANRRCISTRIIKSGAFQNLPKAAQALYLALIADTDDDGIAEAGLVMRAGRFRKRDLQNLVEDGFITIIEQRNNIVWVDNWQTFNAVDTRYYQRSIYYKTAIDILPDNKKAVFKGKNGNFHAGVSREREEKIREDKKGNCAGAIQNTQKRITKKGFYSFPQREGMEQKEMVKQIIRQSEK